MPNLGLQKDTLDLTRLETLDQVTRERFRYCLAMAICAQDANSVRGLIAGGVDRFIATLHTNPIVQSQEFKREDYLWMFDHIKRHAKQHMKMVPTRGVRR